MGNSITPTPGETPQFGQEDLHSQHEIQTESEEIQKRLFEEIQKQNGYIELKTNKLIEYFNSLILEVYRKPLSHFRENYKLKKNYAVRNEFFYKIYVVENIHSKVLHNLKVFKIPFNKFFNEEFEIIGQDHDRLMLTNDLDIMQQFRNACVENLFAFYTDVKKDALVNMVVCSYTTPYTLLDAMNDKIAKSQKFSEMEFEQILKFLLEILNKMKNLNIIHRGLCPSSIFFQKKNDYSSLIIRNFYFASNSPNGKTKGLTGSLWYSAPEILRDSDQDFKVDVYSVGIILYQVLTLRNPFQNLSKKEDILKKIGDGYIQKSLQSLVKLGYNKLYLEKIKRMVEENTSARYSIDEIISNPEIKKIRLRQTKHFLKDYSNSVFNMKTNRNILDKFKDVLTKADKRISWLIYHIFNSGKEYMMDHPMVIKINILFDFLDVNNNNFVTTDEFRDKLIELLVDNEDEAKFKENREIAKDYVDKFREIIELIMDNDYYKMNSDSKQFNFNTFLNASLIIWFFDEKERAKMIKSYSEGFLNHNENAAGNSNQSNANKFNKETKNSNTPTTPFNNRSIANKNEINLNLNNFNLNNASVKNISKSYMKEKSNLNNTNLINEKKKNFGNDFDIYNPECLSISNEFKLTCFVNAFFNTKNFIAFDKLLFIFAKPKFDIKVFSQIESELVKKYMNKDDNIFEINNDDKKHYMSKEKLVKFLEFEYI